MDGKEEGRVDTLDGELAGASWHTLWRFGRGELAGASWHTWWPRM